VLLLIAVLFVYLWGCLLIVQHFPSRSPDQRRVQILVLLVIAVLLEIPAFVYVCRLSEQQSIALGFVCPLCGGALYDGRDNRLGYRGECPCCKQSIIERLSKEAP
jgi:hypothetical protein